MITVKFARIGSPAASPRPSSRSCCGCFFRYTWVFQPDDCCILSAELVRSIASVVSSQPHTDKDFSQVKKIWKSSADTLQLATGWLKDHLGESFALSGGSPSPAASHSHSFQLVTGNASVPAHTQSPRRSCSCLRRYRVSLVFSEHLPLLFPAKRRPDTAWPPFRHPGTGPASEWGRETG